MCLGIQIHNIGNYHWVTTALIKGEVFLYDSLVGDRKELPHDEIFALYKKAANGNYLTVIQLLVQQQSNSSLCGLFSIAFAYHAVIGDDISTIVFDEDNMRSHLIACFEDSQLKPFKKSAGNIKRCDTILLPAKCNNDEPMVTANVQIISINDSSENDKKIKLEINDKNYSMNSDIFQYIDYRSNDNETDNESSNESNKTDWENSDEDDDCNSSNGETMDDIESNNDYNTDDE